MARKPRAEPIIQAEINPLAALYSSFDPARVGTGTGLVNLSNNNLTATAAGTTVASAETTPADNTTVYFEVQINNFPGGQGAYFGLANTNFAVNGGNLQLDPNSGGFDQYGSFKINNVTIGTVAAPTYASGNWMGVAVNFPNKTIQTRNITQNSAWSPAYSFASITPTPNLFTVQFNSSATPNQSATVNFDGTFLGTPPSGGYARWHTAPVGPSTGPRDTFSEVPATVVTVDAIIANGSYTSSGPSDQEQLTFSIVQFGAATLDTNGNLQFQDVVIDDPPLLAITLQVAGPATVSIYGEWDYSGNKFLITTVNIPTSAPVSISNVPILPPNYPQFGQGDILQLFLSCSTTAVFTWSNGHVYGIETVPVWPPVEGSPIPPSIVGRAYTVTGGTVPANFPAYTPLFPPPLVGQGGGAPPTFPPPTPPPIGAIPPGVLVGPAIAAAAVPPSNAGIPLIRFSYGSATAPPASAAFPEFTTTFPSPPIVFSNIFTDGTSPTTPPSTATTPCITISGNYGPPIGPALPAVVPPRQFMVATNGDPADVVEVSTNSESNGTVYDDSDEENEDWVEDTSRRTPPPPKPRGRGRRK